ncbi:MAG: hypothetical protein U0931_04830 [Vulcanimicrobiota bacterium]
MVDSGWFLALLQSGVGLVAVLLLRGRRDECQLSPSQLSYREKTWDQYKLLSLLTFASLAANQWSYLMQPGWRLKHLGLCLTLPVCACFFLAVWLVVTVPVLLRRYNYLTE